MDENALGGVCGAICPVERLCEGACVLNEEDGGAIRIQDVQVWLHDYGMKANIELPPSLLKLPDGVKKKVAVIGSGPAGLSCARELQRAGVEVTIYEKQPKAGGILRYGIAPMRLGDRLIDEEVDRIVKTGVKIEYNTTIKGDLREFCKKNGYDSLFYSPGLTHGNKFSVPGDNVKNIHSGLDFLEAVNKGTELGHSVKGKDVVCIGAGRFLFSNYDFLFPSVSMDVVTAAINNGARSAYVLYYRPLSEMTADRDEIIAAQKNGVIFRPCSRILSCHESKTEKGVLGSIKVIETDWKTINGKETQIDRPNSEGVIPCDFLFFAVRQSPDQDNLVR